MRHATVNVHTERRNAEELIARELDAVGAGGAGIRTEREVAEGQAAQVLLAAADGADLLVLGSSRHGMLADVVLGAVGQECVRHAPCPIVIVRASGPDGDS
jgi:nucleotide-binding universal stress UspA family protein